LGKSLIPALAAIKVGLFTLQGSLFPSLLQHPFLQKAFVEAVIARATARSNLLKASTMPLSRLLRLWLAMTVHRHLCEHRNVKILTTTSLTSKYE
jgi:hypothetical protein